MSDANNTNRKINYPIKLNIGMVNNTDEISVSSVLEPDELSNFINNALHKRNMGEEVSLLIDEVNNKCQTISYKDDNVLEEIGQIAWGKYISNVKSIEDAFNMMNIKIDKK